MAGRPTGNSAQRSVAAKAPAKAPTKLALEAAAKAGEEAADLTVGVEALLIAGNDADFRDFVADLFAASSGMHAVRRALGRATGLTGSEIAMLLAIRRLSQDGPIGVRAIAEHLHVAGPHVTAETAKLLEAGLVEKRVDQTDSRAVVIRLTPEGRRALRKLTPLVRAANDVLFAGMSETEMAHVHKFLRRIVATSTAAVAAVEAKT